MSQLSSESPTITRSGDISLVARILSRGPQHSEPDGFLDAAVRLILEAWGAVYAGVLAPRGAGTTVLAEAGLAEVGRSEAPPREMLGDVLDRERTICEDEWLAAPLFSKSASQEVLFVRGADITKLDPLPAVAAALGQGLDAVRRRAAANRRIHRLETILKIANQWNQTQELEPLLVSMAEAATQLLAADRASIFLWDRGTKTLVGRPALGVENGELRIPEDTGVVGEVVKTGEPRRVNRDADQQAIDRRVDEKTGYQTQTLVCVPLRGAGGELFGAFEVINKLDGNFTDEDTAGITELAEHAATALENTQALAQLVKTQRFLADQAAEEVRMIGESPSIEALRSTIGRVADTELAVLILGENGTGKEVVSQSIHYLSRRRNQPFVAVNCAAIPDTLLESELFGHEKGAFTDAHETRAGKFELASEGTLFLDEIGDLSLNGQAKLLRVLEEKVVVRVGGSTPIHTDARIVAATNQNLASLVGEKKFREDLYFRLNVVTIELPPLRDRGDDILLLAEHFLADLCRKARRRVPKLMAAAKKRLRGHSWPGNVRELRNLMERLAFLSTEDKIDADDLAFIMSPRTGAASEVADDLQLAVATNRFQQKYIKRAIDRSGSNMSEAAERLGLHRSNLYRKMRQLGMQTDE